MKKIDCLTIEMLELKKLLKEKDETIKILQSVKRYDIGEILNENIKLREQLQTNTHQVCEKIRKYINNNERYIYRNMNVIRTQSFYLFLDQIEHKQ